LHVRPSAKQIAAVSFPLFAICLQRQPQTSTQILMAAATSNKGQPTNINIMPSTSGINNKHQGININSLDIKHQPSTCINNNTLTSTQRLVIKDNSST
jgi:hypothetical protein